MRGLFTAGVLDVLMENAIDFDGAVGVSAGAAFGCNYKSNQIGRVIRYNTRFASDKRYSGIGVFLKTGNIYSKDFCYGEVPKKYDVFDFEAYEKNPMEFYVVCTDVESGEAVYHKFTGENDYGFEWIRASASMPLVSRIVQIDNLKLLDGGIADSIPIKFFESLGYDKNIIILTRPREYRKKKNKFIFLFKLKYRKFPNFVKKVKERYKIYNDTLEYIEEKEKHGSLFVIRPKEKLDVSHIGKNPEKLKAVYELGRLAATENLFKIKEFLFSEN